MRSFKTFLATALSALFLCTVSLQAQTYQLELVGTINSPAPLICGVIATGSWTYHVNYHLDKDGMLTRLHWNLKKSNLTDVATGERIIIHDTGTDNLGAVWALYDTINAYNAFFGADLTYNVDDGWLEPYYPDEFPTEGTFVGMNFRIKGKGYKGRYSALVHVTRNAKGELTAEIAREIYQCD